MSFSAAAPSDDEVNAARLDPARLQAVCDTGLLDTPAEESFDRLTRLATRLLEVPATFVSLVDAGRDFYKSTIGFGEPLASARQLQGRTFCHYALLSQGPLLLDDVCALPGFADVPTVQTLGVRAYAGVPLVTPEGLVLGSFCAVDMQPRHWTARDVEVLTELAHATLREITLRQALTQLAETNRLLAEEMHKVGVLNERLSELAHTDALTGLNNRRAYDQQLAREWRRVQRNGAPLSVLLVDADHFKAVNDQHGHAVGDHVLRVLAGVLQESAREIDVAARVGGEEFAVLLADTDATSAAGVAERIRSQIAQAEAMPVAGVTVSIGVATLLAEERPDSLQHRADQALYMAKSQGRNRVVSAR
ncbi:MAG: sensor domain-containing diguanylate cyclase [Aquabacterium sp.]|jgi:diguanylate cyclase (GGDEF)-like protein